MLAKFLELCPEIPAVSAVAEALPFRDGSFDIVTCASAFHWFDHDRALPEIRRCLRPGGRLAIVWNRRDRLTGWAAEFWQITEAHRSETPSYRTGVWRNAIERSRIFDPIEEHWFDHVQRTDVEGLLARIGSISFIEILPRDVRDAVLDEAKRFLQTHPATKDRTTFELPYKTAVYVTTAS
jgi:SAM-dependent methyltransferase